MENDKSHYRQPAGPIPRIKDRRIVNVSLGAEHVEKAREIGHGLISAGLRRAVEVYNLEGGEK